MVSVRINAEERKLGEVGVDWVIAQIERRRRNGEVVCVRVTIHADSVNMVLATPNCQSGAGAGRPPNQIERHFFDRWRIHRLDCESFSSDDVIEFLKEIANLN